ncbi:MAG: protein-ADP-ribose hydrolase [Eubacteriales bacterium]|nr:protein-ADP-ribose hydrolase [Eubacteriales bacterium]
MTQKEKREFLIKELLSEIPQYRDIQIPSHEDKQKRLLRSLMNIRPPRPISDSFLTLQDEYLYEEVAEKGIVDSDVLPTSPLDKRLVLWRGDITTLKIDAIVNAANSALRGCFVPCHSCVDNIIHSVSGIQLRLACDKIMNEQGHDEPVGQAKVTPAYNLPCRFVLHTVGPIVSGPLTKTHQKQLADCYRSCLRLATEKGIRSIAFCCISTGEFHFPQKKAAEIAVQTVTDFLQTDTQIEKVIFNVYKQEDYDIYKRILGYDPSRACKYFQK